MKMELPKKKTYGTNKTQPALFKIFRLFIMQNVLILANSWNFKKLTTFRTTENTTRLHDIAES
jgi:hypothetical protein